MAEIANSIPRQSIDNDLFEEYLKSINDFYGFNPEEDQEHSPHTDPIDVCSVMNDNFKLIKISNII